MAQVHSTAIVGDEVELSEDVVIGPHCILEGRVTLGPGTRLLHHVALHGPLVMGRRNVIYPNACLGYPPQDLKFDHDRDGAGLVIGDENYFREGFTAHRATKDEPTTIGSRNYFMVNTHVGHDARVGDGVTIANNTPLGGHAEVQDGAMLAGNSGVHQFGRVGRLAMVGAGAILIQDLPPFCIMHETRGVGSLNIVGLRRAGYGKHIGPLKRAFDLIFRSRLARPTAVERILAELGDDPLCVEMAGFLRDSKRGITGYGGTRGDLEQSVIIDAAG